MLTDTYSSLSAVNSMHSSLLEGRETLSWFTCIEFTELLLPLLQNWTKMKGMDRSTRKVCFKSVGRRFRVQHFFGTKKYERIVQIIYQMDMQEASNECGHLKNFLYYLNIVK